MPRNEEYSTPDTTTAATRASRASRRRTMRRIGWGGRPWRRSTSRVSARARTIAPRARGAVSFVACISPTHTPVTSAGKRPAFCRYQARPEERAEGEEDEGDLVDVVAAVEDDGRGDRGQQRGDGGSRPTQEAPGPDGGGDEKHPEQGRNHAQGDLVDLDVPPCPLEPGRGQGQVVEGGPVVLRGVVGVAPLLQQGPELVRVDGLVGVHRDNA